MSNRPRLFASVATRLSEARTLETDDPQNCFRRAGIQLAMTKSTRKNAEVRFASMDPVLHAFTRKEVTVASAPSGATNVAD